MTETSALSLEWKSDAYRMVLCNGCGRSMCHDGHTCKACHRTTSNAADEMGGVVAGRGGSHPVTVTVPYSFKLLLQEMSAMGIDWQVTLAQPGGDHQPQ